MTYTHTPNFPLPGSSRRAAAMQAEFELIETQFALVDSTRVTDLATLNAAIALKANIASPTFTGTPMAPTPSVGDDSTKLATTEYVIDAIGATSAFLPPQATNAGKNLYTNGVSASWEFPSWNNLVNTPTTLADYGITNAQPAIEFLQDGKRRGTAPMQVDFRNMSVSATDTRLTVSVPAFPHHMLLSQGIL